MKRSNYTHKIINFNNMAVQLLFEEFLMLRGNRPTINIKYTANYISFEGNIALKLQKMKRANPT